MDSIVDRFVSRHYSDKNNAVSSTPDTYLVINIDKRVVNVCTLLQERPTILMFSIGDSYGILLGH